MSEYLEKAARRFVASRAPWTRGETEDLILKLADELSEWRNGSGHVNGKLLERIAALEAERDALQRRCVEIVTPWKDRWDQAVAERDALRTRVAALEKALLEYWDAKDWGAVGAADSTAAKLLPADMKKRPAQETKDE